MTRRRATLADLPEALALARAADLAALGETDWTEAEMREEWEGCDLDRDVFLLDLDGRLGAYASIELRDEGRSIVDGYVHPELLGRGLGSELLRLTEERACEQPVTPGTRVYIQNATLRGMPGIEELYAAHGYHVERHFWRMLAELEREPEVVVPAGVEIRLARDPEERQLLHEVIEDAFDDHWESRRRPFEEWAKGVFEVSGFDPTLFWVAAVGDEIAGANLCYWKRNGDWGWVGSLGVRRSYRRRGIAEALLQAAFREFWRRGERRVALGVDAQSPTGATRLYEKAGMGVFFEALVYEKELRAAA